MRNFNNTIEMIVPPYAISKSNQGGRPLLLLITFFRVVVPSFVFHRLSQTVDCDFDTCLL
jgi:hypothetical protein